MKRYAAPRTLRAVWAAMLCFALGAVHADDTEIFVSTPPAATNTRPNILFIIDTSGSMDTDVKTQTTYDPATTYDGDCPAGRIYWRDDTSTPSCSSSKWVSEANFVCQSAAAGLKSNGFKTQGPAAQWDGTSSNVSNRKWKGLVKDFDSYVECKEDAAIPHGDGTASKLYPANASNGPFTSNSSQTITWTTDNTNKTYTFYTSNWINWKKNAAVIVQTRLQIVQDVAKRTLDDLSEVNVGLMRYSTDGQGGMVLQEMEPVETVRDGLKKTIEDLSPSGNTPLAETMYEAYEYLSGSNVVYGGKSSPVHSVDASMILPGKTKYKSPIGSACQKNFVVFLTDGEPNRDQDADAAIEALPNFATVLGRTKCSNNGADGTGDGVAGDGKCFDDLAKYMHDIDFYDDPTAAAKDEAKENVTTYTIGFGDGVTAAGLNLLKVAAEGTAPPDVGGGGKFFLAGDTAELTEVFQTIIQSILKDNLSFTAPTVSVNAFNRTQNLNDLFITVFGPADGYHWPGNLKKYHLSADGTIRDADGQPAVDQSDGFFSDGARSFWSASTDGATVDAGGAAHRLPTPDTRNVYTDVAAVGASPANKSLNGTENLVNSANASITRAMLGMDTSTTPPTPDTERDKLIQWVRGADVDNAAAPTDPRLTMGDPLHARPVSVIYGGTAAAPDLNDAVVYTATNDGYLHAIEPSTGNELWTFVPSELLPRMNDLYLDKDTNIKRYGLDGSLRAYKVDNNNNGIVETGDRVFLYFGMGRGGSSYYALDVTDKTKPKLLWRHGAADTLIGQAQSWSTPVVTRVHISGSGVDLTANPGELVVIFAGGYDPTQDAVPYNTDDTGNRLFMLDAISGQLLWHAGPTNVTGLGYDSTANLKLAKFVNSIPSDVRVLDITNDGFADRMYVGDTGGQVWRFDISNGMDANNLVAGGVIASLGAAAGSGGTSPAGARRFYNAPDVTLLKSLNGLFLNLAIGSGFRGHPLNTEIHDRFYALRDYRPLSAMTQTEYTAVVPTLDGDLFDVTTNVTPTIPAASPGWKLAFSQPSWRGEKVLAEARTFNKVTLFTTFTPISSTATACTVKAGNNSLYVVNTMDGSPFSDRDGDSTLETEDRNTPLDQHGIAPEAVILFPSPDDPTKCVGKQCSPPPVCIVGVESCGVSFDNNPMKTFWMQKDAD